MLLPSDFRKGSTKILWKDEPWLVIDYQSVKPGKGGTYMRTKMKNLINGRVLEETFRSSEKLEQPDLETSKMQYLYESDGLFHFMNKQTYDQVEFDKDQLGSAFNYLKENEDFLVLSFKGKPINVEPPLFMVLAIKETVPGVKGDTAQGGSKLATLETGIVVNVPLFLNEGDKIKIDTREDKYIERIEK